MSKKIINSFYECFKNDANEFEKPKIVCDWDEVIQAHEPFATWSVISKKSENSNFVSFFREFWEKDYIKYSPYGSSVVNEIQKDIYWKKEEIWSRDYLGSKFIENQQKFKNSPDFYQEAPFLSIAEELLNLIRGGKIKEIVFLSAYDKRKFRTGDPRKYQIFNDTFAKLNSAFISLQLIGFDNESEGANKADWIKENAFDFDLVIDDIPKICSQILEARKKVKLCEECKVGIVLKWNLKLLLHIINP